MKASNEAVDLVKKFAEELDLISTKRPDLHEKAIEAIEQLLWFLRANLYLNEGRVSVEESIALNLLIEIIHRIDPSFNIEMLSKKEKGIMNELYFGFDEKASKGIYT
ncbi:MAG: hypothetical protein ACFFBD_11940 [Candidatus Hodarchaeota archaeon]